RGARRCSRSSSSPTSCSACTATPPPSPSRLRSCGRRSPPSSRCCSATRIFPTPPRATDTSSSRLPGSTPPSIFPTSRCWCSPASRFQRHSLSLTWSSARSSPRECWCSSWRRSWRCRSCAAACRPSSVPTRCGCIRRRPWSRSWAGATSSLHQDGSTSRQAWSRCWPAWWCSSGTPGAMRRGRSKGPRTFTAGIAEAQRKIGRKSSVLTSLGMNCVARTPSSARSQGGAGKREGNEEASEGRRYAKLLNIPTFDLHDRLFSRERVCSEGSDGLALLAREQRKIIVAPQHRQDIVARRRIDRAYPNHERQMRRRIPHRHPRRATLHPAVHFQLHLRQRLQCGQVRVLRLRRVVVRGLLPLQNVRLLR